ncbi:hypothetical protein CRENBAI_012807, partial [Crenichthys baileyi]
CQFTLVLILVVFRFIWDRVAGAPDSAETPRRPSPQTPPPAPPGGAQGVPRPAERHSPSSVSWAIPWASSRWDVPGTPSEEGVQEASGIDARATSTGSEPLPGGRAPHPISTGVPGHPTKETHFLPFISLLAKHCFPLPRRRTVCQNHFEANRYYFSMASPNSSQARVFASATAAHLASRYPSATSGDPQANHSR